MYHVLLIKLHRTDLFKHIGPLMLAIPIKIAVMMMIVVVVVVMK